jgi:hypothetical protein
MVKYSSLRLFLIYYNTYWERLPSDSHYLHFSHIRLHSKQF